MTSKKKARSASQTIMERVENGLTRQLVLIINNAPVDTDAGPDAERSHRGNTPWLIAIPGLSICVQTQHTGYFPDQDALTRAQKIWGQCSDDPDLLDQLREESAWPENFVDGHKIMYRFMEVSPIG